LLGTYPFNASGTGYKVDLADTSLTGKVVADAVYYVQDGAPVDSFTWTPDIQSAGDYQLYARWTASSANSGAAQYTVVHGGGTSLVTVNQKQNGGQWNLLGTWSFAPGAGHQVTLTAASDGNVVADAIKLVGTGPAPANLVYLHSDQIGLPQKITDATQAIVWDRVQDPFGRQVSLASSGGIDTSLRFPGQQADPDTGFAYNYFRDYDPTLGRYVQADPIGLAGGINRYAYAKGNPLTRIDPRGLDPESCDSAFVDCQREWDDAYDLCEEELSKPNPNRSITGGHMTLEGCAKGLVSERCGGNRIDWGKLGMPLPFSLPQPDIAPRPTIPAPRGGGGGGGPKGYCMDPLGLGLFGGYCPPLLE
jgi:RHS repeat-associated protein